MPAPRRLGGCGEPVPKRLPRVVGCGLGSQGDERSALFRFPRGQIGTAQSELASRDRLQRGSRSLECAQRLFIASRIEQRLAQRQVRGDQARIQRNCLAQHHLGVVAASQLQCGLAQEEIGLCQFMGRTSRLLPVEQGLGSRQALFRCLRHPRQAQRRAVVLWVSAQNLFVLRTRFGLASFDQRPSQRVLRQQFVGMGGQVPPQRLHRSGGLPVCHTRQRHDQLIFEEPAFVPEGGFGFLGLALGHGQQRLGAVETGDRLGRRLDGLQELLGMSRFGRIRAMHNDVEKRYLRGLAPQGIAFVLQGRDDLRELILGRLVGRWRVIEQARRHGLKDILDLGCLARRQQEEGGGSTCHHHRAADRDGPLGNPRLLGHGPQRAAAHAPTPRNRLQGRQVVCGRRLGQSFAGDPSAWEWQSRSPRL